MLPEINERENLWLIVKLKNQLYAINSNYVESIFQLEQPATKVPDGSDALLGIIKVRGTVVSLFDLRLLLGIESLHKEEEAFEQMLDMRKQDHIRWMQELQRCAKENEEFTLATDPHKCALGKWYDNYETDNHSIRFHLNKIDDPHKNLHGLAKEVLDCSKECDKCKRDECLRETLNKGLSTYVPRVLELLEETKVVFRNSYRKMCVVLSDSSSLVGITVDSVIAVEALHEIADASVFQFKENKSLVEYMALRQNGSEQILVINQDILYDNIKTVVVKVPD